MGVRRALALAASALVAATGLSALALGSPQTAPASAASTCQVTDATLTWGFKASFRAYITSSIANGSWRTSGNASYVTPNFVWRKGTGSFAPAATSGQVAFRGAVRFTGHDGLLDSTFSNLRLRFSGARTAMLVVDYTGVSMSDALAGKTKPITYANVSFASLALSSGTRGGSGATTTFRGVPTSITKAGFAAFGSYEPGTALDPMTISITTTAGCGAASSPSKAPAGSGKASAAPAAPPSKAPGGSAPASSGGAPSAAASPSPSIVAASGLQIPGGGATPAPAAAGAPSASPSPTRALAVLASTDDPAGGAANGFLFGVAGVAVGVIATLLIQFAHVSLLARRRKAGA